MPYVFPDHPVISAMEQDGKLRRWGAVLECRSCGGDICTDEFYYDMDGKPYCTSCQEAALAPYLRTALSPEDAYDE